MPKQDKYVRTLPKSKSEYDLNKAVSKCIELQEILQLNIEILLNSFKEVEQDDNHSSQESGNTEEQNRDSSESQKRTG